MHYEAELIFFRKLLRNFHLNTNILNSSEPDIPVFDSGLRKLIYSESDYSRLFQTIP